MYNEGQRELQDRFDSRRIADRLEQVTVHAELSDGDVTFIEGSAMFFLGTADSEGWPDVSYKGGRPGFVRCLDRRTIAFPSYDGNGMFRSLGNVLVNERVALLFVNFEQPDRLRVLGTASVAEVDPLLSTWEGAQAVVRITVVRAFPNCPRYIHPMELHYLSVFAPVARPHATGAGVEGHGGVPRLPAGHPPRRGVVLSMGGRRTPNGWRGSRTRPPARSRRRPVRARTPGSGSGG